MCLGYYKSQINRPVNNFVLRTITGIVFVAVIVLAVWLSFVSMLLLFLLVSLLGIWEFFSLVEQNGNSPQKYLALLVTLFCFFSLLVRGVPEYLVIFPGLMFISELFRKKEQPFINVAYTFLGLIYILLPFCLLAWHSFNFYSTEKEGYYPYLILGVFFLIWSNDTFAYLSGKAFGKTKLFERISPKKTWEGAIGGGVCTVAIGVALSRFYTEYNWNDWIIISLIVVVVGTYGDLTESLFKRSINVKDSGNIIPGHGGILDRFDSFLLAAPFVFFYVVFLRDFLL